MIPITREQFLSVYLMSLLLLVPWHLYLTVADVRNWWLPFGDEFDDRMGGSFIIVAWPLGVAVAIIYGLFYLFPRWVAAPRPKKAKAVVPSAPPPEPYRSPAPACQHCGQALPAKP